MNRIFNLLICALSIVLFTQCGSNTTVKYVLDPSLSVGDINSPQGMAIRGDGAVFVTDIEQNKVLVCLRSKDNSYHLQKDLTITEGLNMPQSLAFHDKILYVSNYGGGNITAYEEGPDGKYKLLKDQGISNLTGNQGIHIREDGTFYIVLFDISTIVVYNKNEKGVFVQDKSQTIKEGLSVPINLTFDHNNIMYVTNFGGNTISVYEKNEDGKYRLNRDKSVYEYLSSPYWVAFDKDERMYVANYGLNSVLVYDKGNDGKYKINLKQTITDKVASPVCVGFLSDGYFCCVNYTSGLTFYKPEVFPTDSLKEASIHDFSDVGKDFPNLVLNADEEEDVPVYDAHPKQTITDGIRGTQNIVTSPEHELLAGNFLGNTVTFYKENEAETFVIIKEKTIEDPNGADGLQFDNNGYLWITQFYNNTIAAYKPNRKGIYQSDPEMNITTGTFGPFSSFISPDGNLLYSPNFNTNNITLVKKNKDGKWEIEQTIDDKDHIMGATGLVVDYDDNKTIYLANLALGIVGAYSKDEAGKYHFNKQKSFRCSGMNDGMGNFGPYRLVIHNKLLYVANYNNGSVFIYKKNKDGIFALAKNKMITGLIGTSGIAFDKDDNIIVSSYGLNSIYVFEKK
jgi:DNA-binding beta-propeller fold protein YncE